MTDRDSVPDRILAAAAQALQGSIEAVMRVDTVARDARVNKRMIYHYYGDKAGLMQAVNQAQWRKLASQEGPDIARLQKWGIIDKDSPTRSNEPLGRRSSVEGSAPETPPMQKGRPGSGRVVLGAKQLEAEALGDATMVARQLQQAAWIGLQHLWRFSNERSVIEDSRLRGDDFSVWQALTHRLLAIAVGEIDLSSELGGLHVSERPINSKPNDRLGGQQGDLPDGGDNRVSAGSESSSVLLEKTAEPRRPTKPRLRLKSASRR